MADGGCAVGSLAHARAFQASAHHAFAGGFDHTRTDLPAVFHVAGIVRSMQVVAKVVGEQSVRFDDLGAGRGQFERLQLAEQGPPAFVFELMTPLDSEVRLKTILAFNKLMWIQNDFINRHYRQPLV